MKKKIDSLMIVTTLICLLPMLLSALLYNQLPKQVAIHFDSSGNPNGYAPRLVAAFGFPIFMALLNVFTHTISNSDPKWSHASQKIRIISKCSICIMTIIIVPITLFMAIGVKIPIGMIVTALVSVLFIICGNYLPKIKQNFTFGIRISWTLNSSENWNKTHHLAGYIWIIGGLLMLVTSFLQLEYLFLFLIVIIVVLPISYSYYLYKRGI